MSLKEKLDCFQDFYRHARTSVMMSYETCNQFFKDLERYPGMETQRRAPVNSLLDFYENELERIAESSLDGFFVYLGIAFSIASNPKKAYEVGGLIRRD